MPDYSPLLQTCVSPDGHFIYGLHQGSFDVANLRTQDRLEALGETDHHQTVNNAINFPTSNVYINHSQAVYEIPNALPFRGTSYIGKLWADRNAADPSRIAIITPARGSMTQALEKIKAPGLQTNEVIADLPQPFKLAVATTSNDARDLVALAESCCALIHDEAGRPKGMVFEEQPVDRIKPKISDPILFELVVNNPALPDDYKKAMVLRPGIQGTSPIVGEWQSATSHVYEYLRTNSYIADGHYAANMADDAVRYDTGALTMEDICGLRGLYYQRTYVRLAESLGIRVSTRRNALTSNVLEDLRLAILDKITEGAPLAFTSTLWGWNFGFDYAPSGYRLHASHQQIHQQYALIADTVPSAVSGPEASLCAYACGDLVQEWVRRFRQAHGRDFFQCYQQAVDDNQRMDGPSQGPKDLVVHADDLVMLFVPKAQTSQWEMQLMPRTGVGNILEADETMRRSLDRAMLVAMQTLRRMGAEMITVIEYSKRFQIAATDQRLLYVFLPRLPEAPGAFSEAQLRWISGHYPEDFAEACRLKIEKK